MINLRTASDQDRDRIATFYARTKYTQPLADNDVLLLAESEGGICAAARVCQEQGVLVLRGMRVSQPHQRRGIGTLLLQRVIQLVADQACYCIPHRYLREFYQQAGFREIEPACGPVFLAERLAMYQRNLGLDVILMKKDAGISTMDKNSLCGGSLK